MVESLHCPIFINGRFQSSNYQIIPKKSVAISQETRLIGLQNVSSNKTSLYNISFDTNLYEINIPLKGRSRGNSKKGCTCVRGIWKGGFL